MLVILVTLPFFTQSMKNYQVAHYRREVGELVKNTPDFSHLASSSPLLFLVEDKEDQELLELITYMLKNKANPNVTQEVTGWTPLHNAAQQNNVHTILLLLKAGANPNSKCTMVANTPLHTAVEQGSSETVHALLCFGANPNEKNKKENTSLHTALKQDQLIFSLRQSRKKIVQLLLKYGADPLVYNIDKDTPLTIVRKEYVRALKDAQKWQINNMIGLVHSCETEAQDYKEIARLLIARVGLYTKQGRIAHQGLAQVLPTEIAYYLASYLY